MKITAPRAQSGPRRRDKETAGNSSILASVSWKSIPLGKKYVVKVELTTLLTAMGAIALKEKCLKIAS